MASRASRSLAVSSCQMISRPRRALCARSAAASTCRCLVTACRLTLEPRASRAIDDGPRALSRPTSARRVGSPSAAKTDAASSGVAANIARDALHLLGPATLVTAIGLQPPRERDAVEARLVDRQQHAITLRLEFEDDQRGRLVRVVMLDVVRVRVPAERDEPLGLDAVDGHLEWHVLPTRLEDLAAHDRAGRERAVEADAEPCAEALRVGHGLPDARLRCLEQDLFVDAIGLCCHRHMQPPGCTITRNLLVAQVLRAWCRDPSVTIFHNRSRR